MNFLSQLNELLHSGHGFAESVAYRAFVELPFAQYIFQSLYCLLGITAAYRLSLFAQRKIREAYPNLSTHALRSFLVRIGPNLLTLAFLATPLYLAPPLLGPGKEENIIAAVFDLVFCLLPVRLLGWALRDLTHPHPLLKFFLWLTEWLIVLAAFLAFLGLLHPLIELIQQLQFAIGDQVFKGENIIVGLLMAILALTIAWQTVGLAEWGLNRYADHKRMADNDARVLSRLFSLTIFLSTAIGVMISSGIEGSTLAAFGGALGIGLGFSLKELAANYFSGIFILLEKAMKIGDHITINSITGRVVHMGSRAIVVRDTVGTESIIPNSIATNGILKNHTLSNPDFRISFSISLRDISDFEHAKEIIETQLSAHPRVLKTPQSSVQITSVFEDAITLEIGLWINDLDKGQGRLISDLYLAICTTFKSENIPLSLSPT